jgi:hypothetical protein
MVIMIGLVVVLPTIGNTLGVDLHIVGHLLDRSIAATLKGLSWLFG